MRGRQSSFESWALGLLGLTVVVILWGAFVRVTGSGAGCADHWPLCNGELVPRSPRLETLIELTHRVTSSLSGLLAIAVFWRSRREFTPDSPVRRAALWGLVLMLVEGAIGAALVKLGLVAKDSSPLRALVVGLHLGNTFLLLAAQMATWLFARGMPVPQWRAQLGWALALGAALVAMLVLGASGAVTALGDTLFPAQTLDEGLRADLDPSSHFLVRLRVWHPLLAVLTGAAVVYLAQQLRAALPSPQVSSWAMRLTVLYVLQLGVGALNLFLLAPAAIQITHLLLADLTWLALVALSVSALGVAQPRLATAAS
ncbi:MAG: COX15/CtaA family protein [Myxococcales bacterium]